jgi:glycosyltransferase involved in cell wall biosynthesis
VYRDFIAGRPVSQDAAWWGPAAIPAAARIARTARSQAIVVTGAPFMSNLWIARGKRFLPRVPLVQEFRDPWADLPDASLDAQGGRDRVTRLEREVLESADAVVTVTEGLSEIIRRKAGATPVHTVTNGFDAEDLPAPSSGPRPFRLIHGGNLFVGRDEPLRALLSAVARSASELPGLELVFRGGFPEDVRREYASLESAGILKLLPAIPARDFMLEVDGAFAALQFNARQFPYLVSTKVYEYAAARRPILSLNYGGEVDALVGEHGLGWSVHADDASAITEALYECHTVWKRESEHSIEPEDIGRYSYPALAHQYRDLVSALARG